MLFIICQIIEKGLQQTHDHHKNSPGPLNGAAVDETKRGHKDPFMTLFITWKLNHIYLTLMRKHSFC